VRIPIESSTSYRGRNSRPNWLALMAFVGLALAAGAVGAIFSPAFSPAGAEWYDSLAKPPWTPVDRWVGFAWSAFYPLMGVSAWIVWSERYHRERTTALMAYSIQLLLNALWAPLFFGCRNVGVGLLVIAAMWVSLVWTIREFASVRAMAAGLMLPYLGWITYAATLNLSLWRHNP